MSAPLLPSPLDYIGRRPFAFYPPIAHSDPNEWVLGSGARSEVQVVNVRTGREIWVAREYIAGVSETSSPLLVVGLTKALDFRAGAVEPKVKRVIVMPSSSEPRGELNRVTRGELNPFDGRPGSCRGTVVGIRLEPASNSAWSRTLIATCTSAIVLALVAALLASAIHF